MAEIKSFPLDFYRNYLDVEDCLSVFRHCNGKQFEAATKLDLCEFLNLRTPLMPVRLLEGEKQRMCYLISQLLKHKLPAITEMKKPWLKGILAACNITESYYKSHYSDAGEDWTSGPNKRFKKTVMAILRNEE